MAIQHEAIIALSKSMLSDSDSDDVSVPDVIDAVNEESDDFDDADVEKDVMTAILMSDDLDLDVRGGSADGERIIVRS